MASLIKFKQQQMDDDVAYLTQFSNSVPVIKFHIDQSVMTIGQDFEMDICIPEDGIADNHASIEAIQNADSYRFVVKSREKESLLDLNGSTVSQAEVQDGDWLIIGGVEFQFTDDGVNSIKEVAIQSPNSQVEPQLAEKIETESPALNLLKDLQDEIKDGLQSAPKKLSTKEFIANSRQSRRRLAI